MPTGSLCAERNVIGTALSDDLSLRRSDLRMIAVLSVSMSDELPTPRIRQVCQPAASSANPSCRNGPIFSFGDTDDTVDVEAVLGENCLNNVLNYCNE